MAARRPQGRDPSQPRAREQRYPDQGQRLGERQGRDRRQRGARDAERPERPADRGHDQGQADQVEQQDEPGPGVDPQHGVGLQRGEQDGQAPQPEDRNTLHVERRVERDDQVTRHHLQQHHQGHDEIQELTDAAIKKIDAALHAKQEEIMQI